MKINKKRLIADIESLRQGFANVLDLMIPYLPKKDRQFYFLSCEAYHFQANKLIVDLGGEDVKRKYKHIFKQKGK